MDETIRKAAQEKIDAKAKPPGSLGVLETLAVRLACMQKTLNPEIQCATLVIFAGDHGVCEAEPAISAYPRSVTLPVFRGVAIGLAASSVLCATNGCNLDLVDVGVDGEIGEIPWTRSNEHVTVFRNDRVRNGSRNMLNETALSAEELQKCLQIGRNAVARIVNRHSYEPSKHVICVGELGIGNTTAASAIVSALTKEEPEKTTGPGTGLDSEGVGRKVSVIRRALDMHKDFMASGGPLSILQAVGGLEIAAMTGSFMYCAEHQIPVVADGYISCAAASIAYAMNENLAHYLFWSHQSSEPGVQVIFDWWSAHQGSLTVSSNTSIMQPILDMKMRLGEGTGAVMLVPILKSAASIMTKMAELNNL
jgi:nicotinate-nucleotide--dimethylbenzimidazole phosphoribosyltransferase